MWALKLILLELKRVLSRLHTMQHPSRYYLRTVCSFLMREKVSMMMAKIRAKNIWKISTTYTSWKTSKKLTGVIYPPVFKNK